MALISRPYLDINFDNEFDGIEEQRRILELLLNIIISEKTFEHLIVHNVLYIIYNNEQERIPVRYDHICHYGLPNIQELSKDDRMNPYVIEFLSYYCYEEIIKNKSTVVDKCNLQLNTYMHTIDDEFNIFFLYNKNMFGRRKIMYVDICKNIKLIHKKIVEIFETNKSMYKKLYNNLWFVITNMLKLYLDDSLKKIDNPVHEHMFKNLVVGQFSPYHKIIYGKNKVVLEKLSDEQNGYIHIYVNESNNPLYFVQKPKLVLPSIVL